jgi:hypothetical protein
MVIPALANPTTPLANAMRLFLSLHAHLSPLSPTLW